MNPQYAEVDDLGDWLNTTPHELTDGDIKGALINLCRQVRHLKQDVERLSANPNA